MADRGVIAADYRNRFTVWERPIMFRPLQDTPLSLSNLQDEMNQLFQRVWHSGVSTGPFDGQKWAPPIDLYEQADHYALYVELPGVDAEQVDVSHVESMLTIRGEKPKPAGATDGKETLRGECRYGTFCRTVELPVDVEVDKLSAKCHAGVLEISIPKSESNRPRSIKITVEEE